MVPSAFCASQRKHEIKTEMWTKQVNCVPSTALANSDHMITNVILTLTHGTSVYNQIFRHKLLLYLFSPLAFYLDLYI